MLLPREVEWIAAQVEGNVLAIHRRAGEEVEKGDVLVTFSNPELINNAEEHALHWRADAPTSCLTKSICRISC